MFQTPRALFLYAVSPVHLGAGSAIGVIDNPIQRERHTDHPNFAGSGLKGAVRHLWTQCAGADESKQRLVEAIFGPDAESSDFAGAASFSDAQVLLFPVRSLRNTFVYATSGFALARAWRTLKLAQVGGLPPLPAKLPAAEHALVAAAKDAGPLQGDQLGLEWFSYTASTDASTGAIAGWLARHALPTAAAGSDYFQRHLEQGLVILPEEDFGFFVRHSTSVEPHVRINDESGTADSGGLFYTENLPPESLLLGLVMASDERRGSGRRSEGRSNGHKPLSAGEIQNALQRGREGLPGLDGALLQVGGDATTGRGHIIPTYFKEAD